MKFDTEKIYSAGKFFDMSFFNCVDYETVQFNNQRM